MKTNKTYAALSIMTGIAFMALSLGSLGFAQTVTPVGCSVSASSVSTNQADVFTATGGNGTYTWSGPNLSVTNSSGSQFAVSYPNPGTYTITVASAGETANCNMTVVTAATSGTLACSPATQNVTLGQTASFSATGGNGAYTWSSPDISITNSSGSGFSANYASTGLKTMTVSSNGATASCIANVLAASPVTTTTPSLPDTGGGYGQQ
ncbi:MAG TPA: PKD domain-containing protein [Candidatus Paceibacterota bacterium]|nr:PKD domain-containing protein [Candidatus Paceibacterota bacterium]